MTLLGMLATDGFCRERQVAKPLSPPKGKISWAYGFEGIEQWYPFSQDQVALENSQEPKAGYLLKLKKEPSARADLSAEDEEDNIGNYDPAFHAALKEWRAAILDGEETRTIRKEVAGLLDQPRQARLKADLAQQTTVIGLGFAGWEPIDILEDRLEKRRRSVPQAKAIASKHVSQRRYESWTVLALLFDLALGREYSKSGDATPESTGIKPKIDVKGRPDWGSFKTAKFRLDATLCFPTYSGSGLVTRNKWPLCLCEEAVEDASTRGATTCGIVPGLARGYTVWH